MKQYISITEDATREVIKTIDLTGSDYKRACKVMNGVEMSMNPYDFTATLHGYEQDEENKDAIEERIEELKKEIANFDASDYITESGFRDMLDECYEPVDICGYKYDAGRALESVDPTAFRCGYADYTANYELDSIEEYRAIIEELEELQAQLDGVNA